MKTRKLLFLLMLILVHHNVQGSDISDLSGLLGRPSSLGYSEGESVSSILGNCYSKIASYPQLSNLLLRMGAPRSDLDYLEFCDNISVFSKIWKIQTLLENLGELYEDTQPILSEFSPILGSTNDLEKDTTIFGFSKKLGLAIKNFKGTEDQLIKEAIGKIQDGVGNKSLMEILNQALCTLSSGPLIKEAMQEDPGSLKKQLEEIAIFLAQTPNVRDRELATLFGSLQDTEYFLISSVFSCFYYVFEALNHAGPFLSISDIQSTRKAIGSPDDQAEQASLYGGIKKIMQTIQTPSVEREESLEVLIGDPSRFFEEEDSLVGSLKRIYEPTFQLLTKTLNGVRTRSCCGLIDYILSNIKEDSDPILYKHTKRLASQIHDIEIYISDKSVLNKLDHQILWKSVMETWGLLGKIPQVGYDLQMRKALIGSLGTFSEGETLSSSVMEIIKGVYLAGVLARMGDRMDLPSGITLFSRANEAGLLIKEQSIAGEILDNFGSKENPDLGKAKTLYRQLTFLRGAVVNSSFLMTPSLYTELLQSIGDQKDETGQTIFGCLNSFVKSLQRGTQDQSLLLVQRSKDQVEDLLFDLYRDAHASSLMQISNELTQLIKDKKTAVNAAKLELEEGLAEMDFPALIQAVYDDTYSLKKSAALTIYPVIGLLSGDANQENLAGNVITLKNQIKISSEKSKKGVGLPSDKRDDIDAPGKNSIFGNVNWLRDQIQNHYTCACLPMGHTLYRFIAGVHAFNDTLHCFISNIAPIARCYPSTKKIRESLIHCNLYLKKMDQTVGEIKKAIQEDQQLTQDSVRRLCRMNSVSPKIKTLNTLMGALKSSIQSVLPEDISVEETRLDIPPLGDDSECKVVQQSLGALKTEMVCFQNKIKSALKIFQELPFFSFPDDGPAIMGKMQQHLTTIVDTIQWIGQEAGPVCEHAEDVLGAGLEEIEGSIRSLAKSAEDFNHLEGLCCSSSDFFIAKISHVLNDFQKILSQIFKYPNLDIFIRDRSFDDLFQVAVLYFLKISEEIKKFSDQYDRDYSVDCTSSCSEESFLHIEKALTSLVEYFQHFAKTKMSIEAQLPFQDGEGNLKEKFRCDRIPSHLEELHQNLEALEQVLVRDDENSSVLSAIQNTKKLSYSLPFIESLGLSQQIFDEVALQIAFMQERITRKKMICKKCNNAMFQPPIEKIRNDFVKLSKAFSRIIDALKRPRCCEEIFVTLYRTDQSMAQITQSFCAFIDSIMADVQKNEQQVVAFNKENFIKIGDDIKNIAIFVSKLSDQFLEIMVSEDGTRCWSDQLQENVQGIFQKVLVLEQTLISIQPTSFFVPQGSISFENECACTWPKYLESMAVWLRLLGKKLNTFNAFSPVLLEEAMKILPVAAINSMPYSEEYVKHGLKFHRFFMVCDAVSYFGPFIIQMSQAFQHLTSTLNSMEESHKSLCGLCKITDFRNALLPWPGLLEDIASPIQGVDQMFKLVQSYNLTAYSNLMLIENSSEFSLTNEKGEAIYQCTKQPSLFIVLVQMTRCSEEYDTKCRPFFIYKGQQVLWDEDGQITTPDLQEYKISDFSVLSMMNFVPGITDMMEAIKDTIQSVHRSFSKPRSTA